MTVINIIDLLYRNFPLILPIFLNGALLLAGFRQAKTANEKRLAGKETTKPHLDYDPPTSKKVESQGELNSETLRTLPVVSPPLIAGAIDVVMNIGAAATGGALANKFSQDNTSTLVQTAEFAEKKTEQIVEGKLTSQEAFDAMKRANVPPAQIADAIHATPGLTNDMYQLGEEKGLKSFLRDTGLFPDAKPKVDIFPTAEGQDRSIFAKEAHLESEGFLNATTPLTRKEDLEQINPEIGKPSATHTLLTSDTYGTELVLPYADGSTLPAQKAHARITGTKRKMGLRGGGGETEAKWYEAHLLVDGGESTMTEGKAASQHQLISTIEDVRTFHVDRGSVAYFVIAFGGFLAAKYFFSFLLSQVTSNPKSKNKPTSKEKSCVLQLYKSEVLTSEAAEKLLRECERQALKNKKSSGNSNS